MIALLSGFNSIIKRGGGKKYNILLIENVQIILFCKECFMKLYKNRNEIFREGNSKKALQ